CNHAGPLSLESQWTIQLGDQIEPVTAYQGTSANPTLPMASQKMAALREPLMGGGALSLHRSVDVFVPTLEEPLAHITRSIFREVVVDHLDVGKIRHHRRQWNAAVGRDRVFLYFEPDFLRIDGERPVAELLRVVEIA